MIDERVVVVRVEGDRAWVRSAAGSGCGQCDAGAGCGAGLWRRAFGLRQREMVLPNGAGLGVGDEVWLRLPERLLLGSAAMLYLLPLLTLAIGAMIGGYPGAGGGTELWSLLGAVVGFGVGLFAARSWGVRAGNNLVPEIARVIPVETVSGPAQL